MIRAVVNSCCNLTFDHLWREVSLLVPVTVGPQKPALVVTLVLSLALTTSRKSWSVRKGQRPRVPTIAVIVFLLLDHSRNH